MPSKTCSRSLPLANPQPQVSRVDWKAVAKEVEQRYGTVGMVPLDVAYDLVRDLPREVIDKTYPDKEALQRVAFCAIVLAEQCHRNNPSEPIPLEELTRRFATNMAKQAIACDEKRNAAGRESA